MTSENLITAKAGITLDQAKEILAKARKEKLPIVDDDYNLVGLITIKDIEKRSSTLFPQRTARADFCAVRLWALQQMCSTA